MVVVTKVVPPPMLDEGDNGRAELGDSMLEIVGLDELPDAVVVPGWVVAGS